MSHATLPPKHALIVRLAVGLTFGLALGWLVKALTPHYPKHPDQWVQIATSVLLLGAFIIWAGAGAMRRFSLAAWSIVALTLIGLIAWNRIAHALDFDDNPFFFNLYFLIYPFLFIAHELVSSGDQAGKPVAPFTLYFDQAWKHGVQLALAVIFTGLFWAILGLGALLLGFIGFHWFKDLITNEYFAFPASGLALAASVHLGDVQTKLMQNFRALVLGVLSWLLPVITVIGLIFAVSLCFSGLEPLWKTKAATASLLGGCVALVLLINATYQQGDEERDVHIILKWAARIACFLLPVFAALAAYSLYLRVNQYGLTPERVLAGVGCTIALLYAVGYPIAAAMPKGRWLKLIETVNITLAFVMVAIFLAVLTPLADPLRLSAESQAARVQDGAVAPDRFDWKVLRFQTGTYGKDALARLTKSGKSEAIRKAAAAAMALKDDERWISDEASLPAPAKPDATRIIMVQPGMTLPADFLAQAYPRDANQTPDCLFGTETPCYVAVIDMSADGTPELLILNGNRLYLFWQTNGHWIPTAKSVWLSEDQTAAFKAGKLTTQNPAWQDLRLPDSSLSFN